MKTSKEEHARRAKYIQDCDVIWKKFFKSASIRNLDYERAHSVLQLEYERDIEEIRKQRVNNR